MSNVQWNAHVHMEGATAKWIGLGWGVPSDPGDPNCYMATITVAAPPEANATVGKVGVNETVILKSDESLACGENGIEIEVTYHVERNPRGGKNCGSAEQFQYNIAENAGQKGTPTGGVLKDMAGRDASGPAPIGQDIAVRVVVPGSCG